MQRQKMEFRDYIEALEQERLKIQVFSKELPLSLELVSQAIEACKQQLSETTTEYNFHGQSECSEQTSMEEGPVLEEFIPIKKRDSPDFCREDDDDDEEDEQHSHKDKILKDSHSNNNDNNKNKNCDKRKSDWLRSVQLWNPEPAPKEDVPRKASVVEVKRNGGAFHPFHREESAAKSNSNNNASSACKSPPAAAPVPATSSSAGAVAGDVSGKKSEEKDGQGQRKQRRCWSPELHKRFLQALQQLGGADSATPKQIRELMKVDGLTNDEVKSHLQKFRLHTRRPSPIMHNNANPTTAPFVLVGNIFVQPPEYTAAVATSTASGEVTTVTAPGGIYAPVATHPPPTAVPAPFVTKKSSSSHHHQVKQLEQNIEHSEGAVHSNSPAASSSSTRTTSTSGY